MERSMICEECGKELAEDEVICDAYCITCYYRLCADEGIWFQFNLESLDK
jgi:hypothetical protein